MPHTTADDVIGRLLRLRRVHYGDPLTLSGDGRFLALTMSPRERAALTGDGPLTNADGVRVHDVGNRVAVITASDGTVHEPFPGTSWAASWSPDHAVLAAYVQHEGFACLGVWDAARDELTLHRHVRVGPGWMSEAPVWTPDGQRVIVRVWADGDGPAPYDRPYTIKLDDVRVVRYCHRPGESMALPDGDGGAGQHLAGLLWSLDATTGEAYELGRAATLLGPVSPQGDAMVSPRLPRGQGPDAPLAYDLTILPLDGSASRTVAQSAGCGVGREVSWSPDGRWLAYTTRSGYLPERLWIVPADGSAPPRELTTAPARLDPHGPPRWADSNTIVVCGLRVLRVYSLDGEPREVAMPPGFTFWRALESPYAMRLQPAPDGRWPVVVAKSATWQHFLAMVEPVTWAVEVVAELDGEWPSIPWQIDRSADGDTAYVVAEAADRPEEVWSVDLTTYETRCVASFNPPPPAGWGRSRVVDWIGVDGEPRQGALLVPPGWSGEPLPVVCLLYQGHHAHQVNSFGLGDAGMVHGQALADRGYAVFWPDIMIREGRLLESIADEVNAAAQALIDQRLADPDRLAVMGQSCGGYCTMAVLTRSELLRTGVAIAGISDITRYYTSLVDDGRAYGIAWCEGGAAHLGGTLWERREDYLVNSPLDHFDQVTAPLLLIHGAGDYGVPADQSRAAFVALRRLDKPVELLLYDGEGHVPTHWREPAYRDFCRRVLAWLDEHLAPRATA